MWKRERKRGKGGGGGGGSCSRHREERNAYRCLVEKPEYKKSFENVAVDGRIMAE
jgi:hypothetical protein